jgi:PKD repeat protein
MKNINIKVIVFACIVTFSLQSCTDYGSEWPDTASIADLTPPKAEFTGVQNVGDSFTVDFNNVSTSATDFAWDFGDGTKSTDPNPSHAYSAYGTYTVKLTASDKLGVKNMKTVAVTITKPIKVFVPEILNAGFEDGTANWKNSALGGVPQITSSPVYEGAKAGKFPNDNSRIAYQTIIVEKNKIYNLTFQYTLKTSPVGTMKVAVLAGHVTSTAAVAGATIKSLVLSDQSSASTYEPGNISFNSGNNTSISILVTNENVEGRIDDFAIAPN